MEELKHYLKSRIENIEKEIKIGKDKFKNIKKKQDLIDKDNINSKNIIEVTQIETLSTSSKIRLFDDCDIEKKRILERN